MSVVKELGQRAAKAARELAVVTAEKKNAALEGMARALISRTARYSPPTRRTARPAARTA